MKHTSQLRIKRMYSVIAHTPNVVELRYGVWNPTSFTLTDEFESGNLAKLLRHLVELRSASELADLTDVNTSECEALFDHLIQLGVVEDGPTTALDHYVDHIIPTLKSSQGDYDQRPILLLGDLEIASDIQKQLIKTSSTVNVSVASPDDPVWSVLSRDGASWVTDGLEFQQVVNSLRHLTDHFVVFCTQWINPLTLQALNRIALELRIPWMQAAIDGPFLFIGPIFVPHRSACYECFETRVTMNLRETVQYQRYKQALLEKNVIVPEFKIEPVVSSLLAAHTALETLNFTLTKTSFTVGKVLAIYLPTMEVAFHEVLRVPSCGACAPTPERDGTELYFDMRAFIQS